VPYIQNEKRIRAAPPGYLDLVRANRIVGTVDAAAVIGGGAFDHVSPGVYDVVDLNGTLVAVATVRLDGTWRVEGGRRHGGNHR
jgi:hypothetical protein